MKTPKQTFALVSLAMAIGSLLAGCSAQPSAGDAERALRDMITQQSKGTIKLTSFHETHGQKGELAGGQLYSLEYEAEIEFTEDCKWVPDSLSRGHTFQTVTPKQQGGWYSAFPGTLMKKGQRQRIKGSVNFENTERGWEIR